MKKILLFLYSELFENKPNDKQYKRNKNKELKQKWKENDKDVHIYEQKLNIINIKYMAIQNNNLINTCCYYLPK